LQRVLKQIERLQSKRPEQDASRIDSLRAAAFATRLTLQDFYRKFQKYEDSLKTASSKNRLQRASKAVQYTFSIDEDVNRLQLYISGQLLSINTLLQLIDR
jgi:hypothetical protein